MRRRMWLLSAAALAGATTIMFAPERPQPFLDPVVLAESRCGARPLAPTSFVAAAEAAPREAPSLKPKGREGDREPVRYGTIGWTVSTTDPKAQAWFDEGLAHFYNFNHDAAIRAFRRAQAEDPRCALCFWGEALALGPNINAAMEDDAVAPANTAMRRALALKAKASARERVLIDALARRYPKAPVNDRWTYDAAFADAMDAAAKAYPDDDFILALAAEANMDTQPWAYWGPDGRTPEGRTARTLELLETVLKRDPDDVPAAHLYIHLTEASANPHRATPYAERLERNAGALGHLLHMPAHTWYRIGRYRRSLDLNLRAAAADAAWIRDNPASPAYEFGYYVHNLHFILTSAQMAGDAATALETAALLDQKLPIEMVRAAPFSEPIKAAPYFAMVQFARPEAILTLKDPGAASPFLRGAWHYARGEAYARLGDVKAARAEAAAISAIAETADFSPMMESAPPVPAADILTIAERTVTARADAAEGRFDAAIAAMTEAVARQETLAYTEPPNWYYPAKRTLAALTLRAGDAERAEHLFMESLVEAPNDGWAYYGLAEALAAQGDRDGARFARALLKRSWAGDRRALSLAAL